MKKMTLVTVTLTVLMATSTTTSVLAADPITKPSTGTVNVTATTDPTKELTLDAVPDIDFGDVAVGTTDAPAKTISSALKTTDLRATGAGWNVTVQYGDGAGAAIADPTQAWKTEDGSLIGKGFEMTLGAPNYDGEGKPTTVNAVTINEGTSTPVVSATGDPTGVNAEGMGSWEGTFTTSDTKITIPSSNVKGKYKAQLVWTLNDTPSA